jgi:hypothetical protein
MIAPLPVQQEELVIVQIVDGRADLSVVHRPAHRRVPDGRGGPTFDRYDRSAFIRAYLAWLKR